MLQRLGLRGPARLLRRRARAVEDAAATPPYFARGYRYARRIPSPATAPAPAIPDSENPLEAYFDAHTEGPGIWKWRHYFEIYHRHLSRFRGRPVHVVEIGVLGGGSIPMWREYFGPDTHIYGVDIDPTCTELVQDGVEIFIGDQGSPAFWEGFLAGSPQIDVVIDDGGHTAHQQAVTMESLLARVRPGGVYICEDIHGPFHPFHAFVDGLTRPLSEIGMPGQENPARPLHQQIASVHRYPIMTVIEKAATARARLRGATPRHRVAATPARGAQIWASSAVISLTALFASPNSIEVSGS